jgi:lipopolysaccharide transport system ATP-binding protein
VRTYSTGMKLRLGFAVAVHMNPGILLIDEVLAVGDLAFQEKCLAKIRSFKAEGCAIVLISHDLSQIEAMCDRALWLRHGELRAYGEPRMLVAEYKAEMSSETRSRMPGNIADQRASSGVVLRPHKNRFGSLEAEIVHVGLLDREGIPVGALESGDPLTVEVTFIARENLDAPVLGISIGGPDRDDDLDVDTDSDRVSLPAGGGVKKVRLHLKRLDLAAGDYSVSVGLYESGWTYAFDYHWRAYPLKITSVRRCRGVISPPRRWTVEAARETPGESFHAKSPSQNFIKDCRAFLA